MCTKLLLVVSVVLASLGVSTEIQPSGNQFSAEQQTLIDEHVFGGLPSQGNLFFRRGYVISYNATMRVPSWVAYHVTPDFRKTPKRKGRFSSFRKDPDVNNPVVDRNYVGLLKRRGYARGHLAPYGVMGGDRNEDGQYAADGDDFDMQTVFQGNYLSNIAPQNHREFNGSGGLWFKLERWIQDVVVRENEQEVWVFAGTIFGAGTPEQVGRNDDIGVPPMFFKIVIREIADGEDFHALAFLFPHQRSSHGDIEDFLVSIDVIESLTGLDFFTDLDDETEDWFEDMDTWDFWDEFREF